jgi:hypothetical protein
MHAHKGASVQSWTEVRRQHDTGPVYIIPAAITAVAPRKGEAHNQVSPAPYRPSQLHPLVHQDSAPPHLLLHPNHPVPHPDKGTAAPMLHPAPSTPASEPPSSPPGQGDICPQATPDPPTRASELPSSAPGPGENCTQATSRPTYSRHRTSQFHPRARGYLHPGYIHTDPLPHPNHSVLPPGQGPTTPNLHPDHTHTTPRPLPIHTQRPRTVPARGPHITPAATPAGGHNHRTPHPPGSRAPP